MSPDLISIPSPVKCGEKSEPWMKEDHRTRRVKSSRLAAQHMLKIVIVRKNLQKILANSNHKGEQGVQKAGKKKDPSHDR